MKKLLLRAMLILPLAYGMGTTSVNASGNGTLDTDGDTKTIDVQATYNDGSTTPTTYKVDLSWESMEFTYNLSGANVWDPDTHQYQTSTTAQWKNNGNKITLTNHSNADVDVSLGFTAKPGYTGITGTFTRPTMTLPSAVNKAVGATELTGESELTLAGTLPNSVKTKTTIGSITVTLNSK